MATTTPNYHLRKPTNADTVNVATDISNNMDLLDAHAHSGTYVALVGGLTTGGVTDNTSVLNTAITTANAAGGGTLILPAGNYAHTGLTQKSGVTLEGSGEQSTILTNTHASNPSVSAIGPGGGGEATYVGDWELKKLQLTRASIASGSHGISLYLSHRYVVDHVLISNHDHGIHESLSWNGEWRSVTSKLNTYGWYMVDSPSAGVPNTRIACRLKQNGTGLHCENDIDTVTWLGCDITDNTVNGAVINGTQTRNWHFLGCNFEFNAGNDIAIGADSSVPTNIKATNCRFARATLASDVGIHGVAGTRLSTDSCKFVNYADAILMEPAFGRTQHQNDGVDTCTNYFRINTFGGTGYASPGAWQSGSGAGQIRQIDSSLFFGTNADTNLFRASADHLQTSDALEVAGALTNGGTAVSLSGHGHAEADVTSLVADLAAKVAKTSVPDIQTFTTANNGGAPNVWSMPTGARLIEFFLVGGGGQGGSGRKGLDGTVRCGGGGGGGGAREVQRLSASLVPASLTVVAGAGGSALGAAQATDSTSGNVGSAGAASTITGTSFLLRAQGGNSGSGGTASTGTGATGLATQSGGGAGGGASASTTGLLGGGGSTAGGGGAGGGSGGGLDTGNNNSAGGAGGPQINASFLAGGTAGTSGGGTGGVGAAASTVTPAQLGIAGSGGAGGGSKVTASAAGDGGVGGFPGGGGGGGGAGKDATSSSGAGGAGANGTVIIVSHF